MKLFKSKTKSVELTREQALACIPVKNETVSWQQLDSGLVQVHYTLVLKPLLASIFKRFNRVSEPEPRRTLELDELGSQVWEMLDGTRSTAAIITEFAAHHQITTQEAEQSITLFLKQLGARGLIALR